MRIPLTASFSAFLVLLGQQIPMVVRGDVRVTEGFMQVDGGPVWFRKYGEGRLTPLLIVHGGPGSRSCVFEPLAELLCADRPVILYDQLGSGRSARPTSAKLWTVDRFVQELAEVRRALRLRRVHIMGHSWGAGLVVSYLGSKGTKGIESVVLAGPYLSTKLWIDDTDALRRQLPPEIQERLTRHELAGTTDSKEYQEAAEIFNQRFLFNRVDPTPVGPCSESKENLAIYRQMWGPTEFHCSGSLRDFDVTSTLPFLKMPILIVVGRFDEARPATAERFGSMIPNARIEILENCAHMAPAEDPSAYATVLRRFLDQ